MFFSLFGKFVPFAVKKIKDGTINSCIDLDQNIDDLVLSKVRDLSTKQD